MSREKLEAAREALEAWNRGDLEGWLKPLHPDIEWSSAIAMQVEGRDTVWIGEAGMRRFWDEWHAVWNLKIDISELRDLGDRVLVLARIQVHGKTSGVEVARGIGYVFDFEGDRIRRARSYLSSDEALEAVGPVPTVPAENVEVVRRFLAALSASPEEIRASVAEFWDADADYYPVRKFPEAQPCHGLEEVSQFLVRFREAWSHLEWAVQELFEVGDDRVLVCRSLRAEGRESGMKLAGDVYQCCWLRHGRLFRVEDHLTLRGALHALGLTSETLEAAGLREQP